MRQEVKATKYTIRDYGFRTLLRVWMGLLFVVLILGRSTATAVAQETNPALELAARAGFDGYYKQNSWLPVQITAANSGSAIDGDVRVTVGTQGDDGIIYNAPLALPTQSNKQLTLIIHPASQLTNDFPVALHDLNGTLVDETRTNRLNPLTQEDLLYGVVTSDPDSFTFLESVTGSRGRAAVAFLDREDLPETAVAWDALDILIFDDMDSSRLTAAQLKALQTWVDNGGQLLITGGPSYQKTTAALADWLPVTINGTISIADLPQLSAQLTAPFRDPGPYLVADSTLRRGELLFHEDGLPLLAREQQGSGAIYFLALDPKLAPLADWNGRNALWTAVADHVPALTTWGMGLQNSYAAETAVSSLPSLSLPSAGILAAFLLFYVLAIGPINYLVLKRLNRRELAWITIPVLVMIFSAVTYFVGFQIRGNNPIINQMAVVYGHIDSTYGRAQSALGLFSPRRADYNMHLRLESAARPLGDNFNQNNNRFDAISRRNDVVIDNIRTDVGEIALFTVDSTPRLPALTGTATLDLTGNDVLLTTAVTNNSEFTLENSALLFGAQVYPLGDLAPGATQQINQIISSGSAGSKPLFTPRTFTGSPFTSNAEIILDTADYYNDEVAFPRWQLLQALEGSLPSFGTPKTADNSTNITLIAWSDADLLQPDLAEGHYETRQTTLLLIDIPLAIPLAPQAKMTVPANMLETVLLADSGLYAPVAQNLYLAGGWVQYEFRPWSQFRDMAVQSLSVVVNGSGSELPQVALWDWQKEAWVDIEGVSWGATAVADPTPFISSDNEVRMYLQDNSTIGLEVESIYPLLGGTLP